MFRFKSLILCKKLSVLNTYFSPDHSQYNVNELLKILRNSLTYICSLFWNVYDFSHSSIFRNIKLLLKCAIRYTSSTNLLIFLYKNEKKSHKRNTTFCWTNFYEMEIHAWEVNKIFLNFVHDFYFLTEWNVFWRNKVQNKPKYLLESY